MKKIFLIYPPSVVMNREGRCQQPVKDLIVIPPLPPLELMYLASIAKGLGFECKIKDYSIKNETLDDFKNDIEKYKPDYLLANVASTTLINDIKVFDIAKSVNPAIVTIATGAHFLTYASETLKTCSSLDIAIKGESEFTLRDILENETLSSIKGIVYKKLDEIVVNEPRSFIENLDEIPFPARDLVDNTLFRRPDNDKIQTIVKVSRGCPFHCFFCLATPVSGHKVRFRSAHNVLKEVQECIDKYKIKNFIFWSDIFDIDRGWVVELCNLIISSGVKIIWSANTRADLMDEELAKLMYKAGCRLVSIGVESGSQEILDKMGKRITLSQARETVNVFKKAKIKVYNYFVIGLPWEKEEHIMQTINFALELDSDFVSFYTAAALPGTRFYEYVQQTNLGDVDDPDAYKDAYYHPTVPTNYLTKSKILELHRLAMRKFYIRPSYIIKRLLSIRSFAELKNYTKAGSYLIFQSKGC